MIRILKWLIVLLVLATAGAAVFFRMAGDDAKVWHVDPATAERTGKPNDFLVAPEGATTAKPDRVATMRNVKPEELLFQFDAIAMPAGAKVIAGSVKELWITYVQRTMILGFPDYITVKAVPVDDGAALIIWSRSRFGHSDFGVNKSRVEGWLAQLGN